ncbi:MAG TPA: Rne/Rng family ribonuclease [Streptosporangiaceae bacterium]|nr:Rne/Rng family ribonuclease [Streptosporangiaceae bacterium]
MLETEPNNQNETARGTESDGGTAPSSVTGTASPGNASPGDASPGSASTGDTSTGAGAAAASGSDPDGGGESTAPPRRTRRPRRAATRAAGPPSEAVAEAPILPNTAATSSGPASSASASSGPASTGPGSNGPASTGPASTGSASSGPPVSVPAGPAPVVTSSPAATPVVPAVPTAATGSGTVPQATFQPPPVIFQPPAAGESAPDRGRVRDEPASEDTGPEEPSGDGASDGTTRRRRRRGGRSRGHEADGEFAGEDAEDDDSAPGRSGREPAERGGKSGEAKHADGKSGPGKAQGKGAQAKSASGKQAQDKADGKSAEGKPGGPDDQADHEDIDGDEDGNGTRRRRRRRRRGSGSDGEPAADDPPNTVVHVRVPRPHTDEPVSVGDVKAVRGSTRLEAKRQRRREGRESGRRRPPVITEAEFLARRESVDRVMVVRQQNDRTQIGVLEDGVLVEHYVDKGSHQSMVGNVYLGKVQNVLPSMEAAFVDVGKGRNAVLYAGEVNFDASGLEGDSKRIESALKSGQSVLVQVTKDPVGHKGARLTSQVSLPGRYLVYVPGGSMMGISRKLPDKERTRLKQILKQVMPEGAGVIVRTAAEGATEEELSRDVARLAAQWEAIEQKSKTANAPELLYSEPDLTIRVVRDIFNEDFASLVVEGDEGWDLVYEYVRYVAPHLAERLTHWTDDEDVFAQYRIDEQLAKALERKVWLPSGGSLVIDNTEAMTVVDVNTGKFTGQGGNLEETVTRNNLEAAEEIVRQLRLRDVGGIIVIDFIDMVLESNRELVLRRMLECLARDRTKHQVAEVTSLGLVQMTRKRVGSGLLEAFSEPCDCCNGRGRIISLDLTEPAGTGQRSRSGGDDGRQSGGGRQDRNGRADRNGHQDRNGRGDGRGDRNGSDKNSSDKSGRNGRQDRNGQPDRPAADHDAAAAPDAGDAAASEPAALLVAAPGERQGGRRRRRSATRPAGAPDAEILAATEAVASTDTGSATGAEAGPATVPGTHAAPAGQASREGEARTTAETASAVSSWPASDAPAPAEAPPAYNPAPAWEPAPAWDPAPGGEPAPVGGATPKAGGEPAPIGAAAPAADPGAPGSYPADGDNRPADEASGPADEASGSAAEASGPSDEGPAATDEEHPPF